jgi:shikimate kinase
MNIYLIGYRCCGKTSVGKALSHRLKWPFMDTDAQVVKQSGMSIAEMVSTHGWTFFRNMENSVVDQTRFLDRHVIATGGGVVLNPDNVRITQEAGRVIWLKVSPQMVRIRMAGDPETVMQRPGLTAVGSLDEIETVLMERQPIYEKAGHLALDTDILDVESICRKIIEYLRIGEA